MQRRTLDRAGLSLLELLAVVSILGVIAATVIPRMSGGIDKTKGHGCHVQVGIVEIQSSLWKREHGRWPSATLSDIGADRGFFPDGLPVCPVDGSAYQIDGQTGKVIGHLHE